MSSDGVDLLELRMGFAKRPQTQHHCYNCRKKERTLRRIGSCQSPETMNISKAEKNVIEFFSVLTKGSLCWCFGEGWMSAVSAWGFGSWRWWWCHVATVASTMAHLLLGKREIDSIKVVSRHNWTIFPQNGATEWQCHSFTPFRPNEPRESRLLIHLKRIVFLSVALPMQQMQITIESNRVLFAQNASKNPLINHQRITQLDSNRIFHFPERNPESRADDKTCTFRTSAIRVGNLSDLIWTQCK